MPAQPLAKLLIVDDEIAQMTALCRTLEEEGHATTGFASAREALAELRKQQFDLVLTDLVMPGIDGSHLIHAIKQLSPQTPAVLISGRVKIYERDTQADVFLPKGMYEPIDLLERIRLLLVRNHRGRR